MGIDVVVFNSNDERVPKQVFLDQGFPSDSPRHFGIVGWIPLFNALIGEDDLVDRFAYEMKSAPNSMIETWWIHLEQNFSNLTEDQEKLKSYISFVRDQGFTLVFW